MSMAVNRSAALVFIVSDSGEVYITVDGNEGDRYVMPSGKRLGMETYSPSLSFSVKTLQHGMEAMPSYKLWHLKTITQLSS